MDLHVELVLLDALEAEQLIDVPGVTKEIVVVCHPDMTRSSTVTLLILALATAVAVRSRYVLFRSERQTVLLSSLRFVLTVLGLLGTTNGMAASGFGLLGVARVALVVIVPFEADFAGWRGRAVRRGFAADRG